jgi:hypothetical protein
MKEEIVIGKWTSNDVMLTITGRRLWFGGGFYMTARLEPTDAIRPRFKAFEISVCTETANLLIAAAKDNKLRAPIVQR